MNILKLSLSKEGFDVGSKIEHSISSTVPYNHSLLLAFVLQIPPWPHIPSATNGGNAVNHEQILHDTIPFFLPEKSEHN